MSTPPGPDLLAHPEFPINADGRPPWQPDYPDVAGHLVNFTRDPQGVQQHTFNRHTAIKPEDVARCIYDATDEVRGYCGPIPDLLAGFAKATAAIGAAGNAVRDLSPGLAGDLMEEYKRRLKSLSDSVARESKRDDDGQLPKLGVPVMPRHTFPKPFHPGGMAF